MTTSKKAFNRRVQRAVELADIPLIFSDLGVKLENRGNKDFWFCCVSPRHNEHEASAHIEGNPVEKHYGVWHCFGCKSKGNVVNLVQTKLGTTFAEALGWVEARINADIEHTYTAKKLKLPSLPSEYESPDADHKWNIQYLQYLHGRGIPFWQIKRHKIGYCDRGRYMGRIVVPVYLHGHLRTWVGRNVVPGQRVTSCKNGKVGLVGSEMSNIKAGPAIISEGWADALKIERLGYSNSMAVQTNRLHEIQFAFLRRFGEIIVVPDADKGGREFVNSLTEFIGEIPIRVAKLPDGQDPDDAGAGDVCRAIDTAKDWTPVVEERSVEITY